MEEKTPVVERVQKVADYFDVSMNYLLGRETIPEEDLYDEDLFAIERATTPILFFITKKLIPSKGFHGQLLMNLVILYLNITYVQIRE
ncbi:hypothetical protein IEQ_05040 [Bacillus cereus BAG6X1-2]|nr:hypothetical protein IEQ_05040 [Bacillus cereus BAG6X1-2]